MKYVSLKNMWKPTLKHKDYQVMLKFNEYAYYRIGKNYFEKRLHDDILFFYVT